jgi:hypothetical protein
MFFKKATKYIWHQWNRNVQIKPEICEGVFMRGLLR